jgi:hypothetical protein
MSLNVGGWINFFLVDVQITNFVFEVKSNSLTALGVDPSPTSGSFILGVLGEHLFFVFLAFYANKRSEIDLG